MKKTYLAAVLMLTCLLGVEVSARAQDADAVIASVSFEFVAGGVTLPAGKYRIERVNNGANRELIIHSSDKSGSFLLPVVFEGGTVGTDQTTLGFKHVGGKYFLSSIKTLDGVYTMADSREMIMLAQANSPSASPSSASGSH
jgi:hypothetical protein